MRNETAYRRRENRGTRRRDARGSSHRSEKRARYTTGKVGRTRTTRSMKRRITNGDTEQDTRKSETCNDAYTDQGRKHGQTTRTRSHARTQAASSLGERVSRPTRLRVADVLTLALNLRELPGEAGEERSGTRATRGNGVGSRTWYGQSGAHRRQIASSRASLCAARQYSGTRSLARSLPGPMD